MAATLRWLTPVALAALALGVTTASAAPPERIRAPEFDGGTGWLGTNEALTLQGLRGKIVVFDFWTLC